MPYIAVDGDDVGRKLERLLLANQIEEAKSLSSAVESELLMMRAHFEEIGAEIIFCAGDSLLAQIQEPPRINELPQSQALTWSIGIEKIPGDA